eukprot:9569387-Karenia_brevis.AAC.1
MIVTRAVAPGAVKPALPTLANPLMASILFGACRTPHGLGVTQVGKVNRGPKMAFGACKLGWGCNVCSGWLNFGVKCPATFLIFSLN